MVSGTQWLKHAHQCCRCSITPVGTSWRTFKKRYLIVVLTFLLDMESRPHYRPVSTPHRTSKRQCQQQHSTPIVQHPVSSLPKWLHQLLWHWRLQRVLLCSTTILLNYLLKYSFICSFKYWFIYLSKYSTKYWFIYSFI